MSMWGANPEELLAVAKRFDAAHDDIATSGQSADAEVQGVEWVGRDRDDYVESWGVVAGDISALATLQRGVAEYLAHQAAQQEIASSAEGAIDLGPYGDLVGGGNWAIDVWNFLSGLSGETVSNGDPWFGDDGEGPGGFRPEDIDTSAEGIANELASQGIQGDCWFISALMATASTKPEVLADNITPLGDPAGSEGWVVDLYLDGEWREITVRPEDIGQNGTMNDTNGTAAGGDKPGVFSIYEEAMMQHYGDNKWKVWADNPDAGLRAIHGPDVEISNSSNAWGHPPASEIKQALDDDRAVTVVTTLVDTGDTGLVPAHVYEVVDADPDAETVTLRNPHGPDSGNPYEVTVPLTDISLMEMAIEQPPKGE